MQVGRRQTMEIGLWMRRRAVPSAVSVPERPSPGAPRAVTRLQLLLVERTPGSRGFNCLITVLLLFLCIGFWVSCHSYRLYETCLQEDGRHNNGKKDIRMMFWVSWIKSLTLFERSRKLQVWQLNASVMYVGKGFSECIGSLQDA